MASGTKYEQFLPNPENDYSHYILIVLSHELDGIFAVSAHTQVLMIGGKANDINNNLEGLIIAFDVYIIVEDFPHTPHRRTELHQPQELHFPTLVVRTTSSSGIFYRRTLTRQRTANSSVFSASLPTDQSPQG